MRCLKCDGEGLVPVNFVTADRVSHMVELPCPACHGSGRVFDNENTLQETPARTAEIAEDALD